MIALLKINAPNVVENQKKQYMESKSVVTTCPQCRNGTKGVKWRENKRIENMRNGSCGVCGGKGEIEWIPVGRFYFSDEVKYDK